MTRLTRPCDKGWRIRLLAIVLLAAAGSPALAAADPDLIFRRSTVFKWLSPNDKLATYGIDDPEVEGVACHFTVPERGGVKGWLGIAEEVSDISLASKTRWGRATTCSGGGDRFSSRRCRSCAAATPSGTCWSIWFTRTD